MRAVNLLPVGEQHSFRPEEGGLCELPFWEGRRSRCEGVTGEEGAALQLLPLEAGRSPRAIPWEDAGR